MTHYSRSILSLIGVGIVALACGSSPPPKAEPAPNVTPPPPVAIPAAAGAAGTAAASPTDAQASPATTKPTVEGSANPPVAEPSTPAPKIFPVDVMTARETAFLLDYDHSSASEVAKKSCSGKTEEDEAKHAECLTKAHDKFGADVLRFKTGDNDKGPIKLSIYRRTNNALAERYTATVTLKEISPNLVKVEIKGGASGQRPILRDRGNFEVKVPNLYSIEIEDPTYGTLSYDAKVGLVAK
jgi:hypothetical protein